MTDFTGHDRADKPKSPLGQRLDAPLDALDLPGLAARWFGGVLRFRLQGLAAFAADPGLPGRIRGALGERLKLSASEAAIAGQPCPWQPPCAFEVLWRKQGRMSAGLDHASPWVIGLDPVAGDLEVTLTLFGFANEFMAAASEAMTAALLGDVDWRGATGLFVPRLSILERQIGEAAAIEAPPPLDTLRLAMLSPLALTGADPRERPGSLVSGLARRLETLARWHDATLAPLVDPRALGQRAAALDWQFDEVVVLNWQRGSRRQDKAIPMRGIVCGIEISGLGPDDADLRLLLALGEACFFGADVAFGCGRYALAG